MRVYGLTAPERACFLETFVAFGLRPAASGEAADVFRRVMAAVPGKTIKHVSLGGWLGRGAGGQAL
jgi:hypothetical protein